METFKRIDLFISIALIAGFGIVSLIKWDLEFVFNYFYLTTGAWQLISMFIHAANGWFLPKGGSRSFYHWIVLIIIAIAALGMVISPLLLIFYILLFAAPLMAMYYTLLCYKEVKELKIRHSLALK